MFVGLNLQTIIIRCQSRINEPGFINYGGNLQIVIVPFDTEKWYLPNFQQL